MPGRRLGQGGAATMSGSEVQLIEGAFAVALVVMVLGVAAGRPLGWWARDPAGWPGKVAPPGILAVDLAGVAIVTAVYFGFHWLGTRGATPTDAPTSVSAAGLVVSILAQAMILGMVLMMIRPRCPAGEFFGLHWPGWPWALLIGPLGTLGAWLLIGTLHAGGYFGWMKERLSAAPLQESVNALRESNDPLLLGLMTFTAVVVAPLCEEAIFRGYVYPVVKRFAGPWLAAAGSALLFAAAHSHAVGLVPLWGLGLILVAAYERTGSLWAPVAVHACFNGATVGLTLLARVLDIPLEVPQ